MPVHVHIPRWRKAPTKKEAAIGALTSLIPNRGVQPGKGHRKAKSAGGLALLAGLGAAAFKVKGRRSAAGTPTK